ncbi:hypothetical protein J2752_000115 [Halarchaeum rubridurum]|uniref:Uncharacterized protein n=1 Tax=Halarchaeum rubridurum TaxID=489911 RepID=A0A830FYG3_9EURY|nr:hypothetical protein [Halarchaeum rubridurum]MBP1953234.1 hypothetical protein [Halarchaeum rubridurum]GGM66855.1 hypothetical protein GCM10009017_16210 [Halarchaeum rubridurum]
MTGAGPIYFETVGEELRIHDRVMDATCRLTADRSVDAERVSDARFLFPVDAAVSFEATTLSMPANAGSCVRDERGDIDVQLSDAEVSFPRGTYYVDVEAACKLYVKVFDAAFEAATEHHHGEGAATLAFEEPTRVAVGARSRHERPHGTITVPDDPGALRETLPYLASAVKEWSSERSWPTLRGHPPRIERGDALSIPSGLTRPDTGVTLAVPETYASLYAVAPLAYYLGADVVEAPEPELRLDNGFRQSLGDGAVSPRTARALLERCFFLDTLVRTAGYYDVPRQEYEAVAGELSFYPPALYDRPIPEQLMEYLEAPRAAFADSLPDARYAAVVRDDPTDAPLLPFLVRDLVPIAVGDDRSVTGRALATGHSTPPIPDGDTRLSVSGFEHGLARPVRDVSEERIALLGVDDAARDALSDVLIGREHREADEPFTVETAPTTTAAVRDALETDYGFVHVASPLTAAGFDCRDGVLDPTTLDDVSARVVSAVGGQNAEGALDALIERGARAGVVSPSLDSRTAGRTAGRFLSGAPFERAVMWSGAPGPFRFAGDVTACPVVLGGGVPISQYVLRSESLDNHRLWVRAWWSGFNVTGGLTAIYAEHVSDRYRLVGTEIEQPPALSSAGVAALCNEREAVYVLNGEVYQHDHEVTPDEVRQSAARALADRSPTDSDTQF